MAIGRGLREVTVIIEIDTNALGTASEIKSLRIEAEDVPTEGRTLIEFLREMLANKWVVASISEVPWENSKRLIYEFKRVNTSDADKPVENLH